MRGTRQSATEFDHGQPLLSAGVAPESGERVGGVATDPEEVCGLLDRQHLWKLAGAEHRCHQLSSC